MLFRVCLLVACCGALATAGPAPQTQTDAFGADDAVASTPSLGTFLQTLSTVTNLLNRFSRTFQGPAQYNEFDDVETAQPRVTLTEEKDVSGGSVYKVTIVRPADSGPKFSRQMESTTAAPTTQAPSQGPPTAAPTQAPSSTAAPPPSTTAAPPAPSSTTASPAAIAAEVERTLQRRIQEIAFQLEQEENRMEQEQERRELEVERRRFELELQGRRAAEDFDRQQQEQERRQELDERRREIELEQALLNQERAVLGQIQAEPNSAKVTDQTAAGSTITRIIHTFDSRENDSEERLLHAIRQQNPNIKIVSAGPRQSATITDQRGRPIRVRYDSPEISLEDRLRYGANPKLIQVSRDGAKPVYRFADSDEILYSALYESSQKATAAAQSPAPLVKQSIVAAPAPLRTAVNVAAPVAVAAPGTVNTDIEFTAEGQQQVLRHTHEPHHEQPKYRINHEMFSSEEEDDHDLVDESALSPLLFLFKKNQQLMRRENFESMEEINRSGNRLDEDAAGDELTEFEREWQFNPQPPNMQDDMRVNRIFRTRNADYHNPEAETIDMRMFHGSSGGNTKKSPIK